MKVFAFSGVNKAESVTNYVVKKLVEEIFDQLDPIERKLYFQTSDNLEIGYIEDASSFFLGYDNIHDDMDLLRKQMLDSDLIIFASPVYLHQVSGKMKSFIDRISYWAHLIKLAGKTSISVSISDSNGADEVDDYLRLVLLQLGTALIDSVKIESGIQNLDAIDSILHVTARRVARAYQNNVFPIANVQEEKFEAYKKIYSLESSIDAERNYWENNDYFKYANFKALFESKQHLVELK